MSPFNPFEIVRAEPQSLIWTSIVRKIVYDVELILPLKAQSTQCRLITNRVMETYMTVCAEIMEDQEIVNSNILKGEFVKISFPIKTTINAFLNMNLLSRKQMTEDVNVRIKFIKQTDRMMKIIFHEVLQPTKEQIDFGNKYYSSPIKGQVVVRQNEEL